MQTRAFSSGKHARSSELPKTDILQTRPFSTPSQKGSEPEVQPLPPESLEKASAFGFNGASIPLFAPEPVAPIQAKLTVGEAGDEYEQEADTVAAEVVDQINTPQSQQTAASETVQREEMEEEEVREKPEVGAIQREDMLDEGEEEKISPLLESATLQRDEMPQEEEETEISRKLMVQVKAANGGVGSREMVPQPQANQNATQDVSKTNQRTPLGDESLYAFVDGGVITIPLTVGAILIIVGATGLVINWKDITGNLTEVTTIAIDWVTDTASDVTSKIIDKLSQGVGVARGILEKARGAIEGVVSHIFASKKPKRGNDSENQEFEGAVSQIQKIIGRKLNKDERQALHQAITGQGYTFWEIVITGIEMFGTVEDLEKIPKNQVPPGWEWW